MGIHGLTHVNPSFSEWPWNAVWQGICKSILLMSSGLCGFDVTCPGQERVILFVIYMFFALLSACLLFGMCLMFFVIV